MTVRILTAVTAVMALSACSKGQKGDATLSNEVDSVSYAIGVDIGMNFKRSKMENMNIDAMAQGLRDGMTENASMDEEMIQNVVQGYMMKLQEERLAEEQAQGEANRVEGEEFLAKNAKRKGVVTTDSGLQYEVIKMGTGPKPQESDRVKVHYVGTLIDGTEFDSSVKRGEPATFGVTQVIRGWVEGLQLMPEGSKWKLAIPSDLAYGPSGGPGGTIPPNSVLVFEVELLEILK
jgi:FKBP-type peptidyl-prolyl cis-trans isomerase FklB